MFEKIDKSKHLELRATEPNNFEGAEHQPYGTMFWPKVGEQVDLYHITLDSNEYNVSNKQEASGQDAIWLGNNAAQDEDDEFGIKLYCNSCGGYSNDEQRSLRYAKAALDRQRAAYEAGAAPPAHRLVRVLTSKMNDDGEIIKAVVWGYQTSVAELGNSEVMDGLRDKAEAANREHAEWYSKVRQLREELESLEAEEPTDGPDCDCDFHIREWARENGIEDDGPESELLRKLEDADFSGVQGYKTEIGVTVDARMKGDGDLHNENVGTYKGELVALDFGSHFTGHV